ncbi:MAG: acylphosphatase [Deltaproteobacteria bacterium]|nr:acylphosphatase [Deltaproteobacteria bacterium]
MFVSGRVQGVWFRAETREKALSLSLSGWVRNLSDGRVEVYAVGPRDMVDRLIEWCHDGPPLAKVRSVAVTWVEPEGTTGFDVRP